MKRMLFICLARKYYIENYNNFNIITIIINLAQLIKCTVFMTWYFP